MATYKKSKTEENELDAVTAVQLRKREVTNRVMANKVKSKLKEWGYNEKKDWQRRRGIARYLAFHRGNGPTTTKGRTAQDVRQKRRVSKIVEQNTSKQEMAALTRGGVDEDKLRGTWRWGNHPSRKKCRKVLGDYPAGKEFEPTSRGREELVLKQKIKGLAKGEAQGGY